MAPPPVEITLEISPRARLDVIDVAQQVRAGFGDVLARYRKALYCSYHTTAGYLEQSLCSRLNHSRDGVDTFVGVFGRMFPPNADYGHNKLHLRSELTEEQRRLEPPNADSHLAFIGAGLRNCVVYRNRPETPVFFVDLDGVHENRRRQRQTTVVGFNREQMVERVEIEVPVSGHSVDSINLRDPGIGLTQRIEELLGRYEISKGRVDIALDPAEQYSALTVNEYETLLMKHDLAEVLRNPMRFMAEKGKHMLQDPRAIPSKTWNYARYDLVQVINSLINVMGASESWLETILAKCIASPAARFLRMRRSVSLLVSNGENAPRGSIVAGTYQTPILVQWKQTPRRTRLLDVTLVRFD